MGRGRAGLGLPRLYGELSYGSLPAQSRAEMVTSIATASNLRSTIDEYAQANRSVEEASALTDFGNKPLVVLTAGSGSAAGWMPIQGRLAALSTNSAHRVVDGATHEMLAMDEAAAASTTRATLDVVSASGAEGRSTNERNLTREHAAHTAGGGHRNGRLHAVQP